MNFEPAVFSSKLYNHYTKEKTEQAQNGNHVLSGNICIFPILLGLREETQALENWMSVAISRSEILRPVISQLLTFLK